MACGRLRPVAVPERSKHLNREDAKNAKNKEESKARNHGIH
jgi:hypothetical protein